MKTITKQKKRFTVILFILIMIILATTFAGTFAWIAGSGVIECDLLSGSLLTQYFHTGTGTEDDPFVITRPLQYYNLVYLYQRKEGFADNNYYFQLGYDLEGNNDGKLDEGEEWLFYKYEDGKITGEHTNELDLGGYEGLLPIGTSAIPFNSTFNGNGLVVKNLNVISAQTINDKGYNTCDAGVFGYVGGDAVLSNVYYENLTIDLTGLDPTTVNDEDHNDTIHNSQATSYVGFIAGHIVDTAKCEGLYINACTVKGGAAAKCNFGYFGVVENSESGASMPQLVESIKELRGAGAEAGFGGSINMKMMYDRLTAIHRKSYTQTYRYLTARSKIVDEVTGEVTFGDFDYEGVLTASNYQAGEGYFSPTEGNFIFGSNNGRSGTNSSSYTWSYHYVSGLNTTSTDYRVTTYIYTKKADPENPSQYLTEDGIILSYNGYYLALDGDGNIVSTQNADDAQVFVPEDGTPLRLYTRFDGEKKYLAPNGTTGIRLADASTNWNESAEGEIYTVSGGFNYALYCDNEGNWGLVRSDAFYLNDGGTNYLSLVNGNVQNTNGTQATRWLSTTGNLNQTGFSCTVNGNTRYLGFDNGALVSATSATTWNKDENGYYTTSGNEKFYIVYEGGTWKAVLLNGTYISDENDNYLSSTTANSPAVTNATSADTARPWIVTQNGGTVTIATVVNGTKYYLGNNKGTLTLTTTSTNWTKNGNSYYVTADGTDYYLTNEGGTWLALSLSYQVIKDGATNNWLRVTGANGIANATNVANATHFYFANTAGAPSGKVFCIVNGTVYYLRNTVNNNNGNLQTDTNANNATAWVNDGSSLSYTSTDGKYTYALRYNNNAWSIQTFQNKQYVTDGNGNYLRITGTGTTSFENTRDKSQATLFTFDDDGKIHATYGTSEVYLRNNSGTFQLTTYTYTWYRTQWTIGTNNISDGNYYLVCDNGTWSLTPVPYYTISVTSGGTTYYMGANGTTLTATTNVNEALHFSGTSKYISTTVNGQTRYLYISTSSPYTVSLSTDSSYFTNSQNRLYYRSGNNYYSITFTNNNWGGRRDKNTQSGTVLTFTQRTTLASRSVGESAPNALPSVKVNTTNLSAPVINTVAGPSYSPVLSLQNQEPIVINRDDGTLYVVEKTELPHDESSRTSTYFPLRTELHDVEEGETYSGSDPYGVSPKNTGYVIGGNYENSTRHADIRVSQYDTGDITNSYNNNTKKLTNVYTNDNKSGTNTRRTLTDGTNGTLNEKGDEYYAKAEEQFLNSIDGNNIYGLHFMNSEISMNHIIEVENALILGKRYQNYQFPEDCIDFRTVEPGYISFFAGTYFSGNNAFFSLHEIFRNDDKTIASICEIKYVYAKYTTSLVGKVIDTSAKYINVYYDPVAKATFILDKDGNRVTFSDSLPSGDDYKGYEMVFDTTWITAPNNIRTNAVYFFKIPCNVGEYALGSVKGMTGAYLMYLDIGTNGGNIMQTIVSTPDNVVKEMFKVDVRSSGDALSPYAILQISTEVPECAKDNYSLTVSFDKNDKGENDKYFNGTYTITVVNNTGGTVRVFALLCDDDEDLYNDYGYAYKFVYTNDYETDQNVSDILGSNYWQMAAGFDVYADKEAEEIDYVLLGQ